MACSVCKDTTHKKPKCPNKQKIWEERHAPFEDEYQRLLVDAVLTPKPPMPAGFSAGQGVWDALHSPGVFALLREKAGFVNIQLSPLEAALVRYWSLGRTAAKWPGTWDQTPDEELKAFVALRNQIWDGVVHLAKLQQEISSV